MSFPIISKPTKLPIRATAAGPSLLTIPYSNAAAQYTPAPPGSVATETQNIDEPGRVPYQEDRSANGGGLIFSTVTTERRRVLLHANCIVTTDSDMKIIYLNLHDDSPASTIEYLPIISSVFTKSKLQYTVLASSPQYYIDAGYRPEMSISMDSVITHLFYRCRLSGYDIILPVLPSHPGN